MMREVIRTKRMPPWHADPHIGVWKNDKSLSIEQARTLVHWIEAGAPRGSGEDPLKNITVTQAEWPLGEPDLILDLPTYDIPASGVVEYKFPRLANPMDKGVWVKAATVIPGNREVFTTFSQARSTPPRRKPSVIPAYSTTTRLATHRATSPTYFRRTPVSTLLRVANSPSNCITRRWVERLPTRHASDCISRQTARNFYRQNVVLDPTIEIPPNEARHAEVAYYAFDKHALLHDLVPHSHYRGVASKFELQGPDGSRETVLSVPNYDFNWQRTYTFVEPKRIEPGSKLIHTTWYDNSAANPGNPDPNRTVPWGLQSWDEMLYGAFSYTLVDETSEAPILNKELAEMTQMVGFMDKDLDGKLSWQELPGRFKRQLVKASRWWIPMLMAVWISMSVQHEQTQPRSPRR